MPDQKKPVDLRTRLIAQAGAYTHHGNHQAADDCRRQLKALKAARLMEQAQALLHEVDE